MRALVSCLTTFGILTILKFFLENLLIKKNRYGATLSTYLYLKSSLSKGNDRKWTVGKQRVEMYYDRFTKIKRSDLGRWFIDNSERFIDPRNEIHNNYFSVNNSGKSKKRLAYRERLTSKLCGKIVRCFGKWLHPSGR